MEGFSELAFYGGIYCGVCLFWTWLSSHYRQQLVSLIGVYAYRGVIATHFAAAILVGGVVLYVFFSQTDMKLIELLQFGVAIVICSYGLALGWKTVEELLKG